MNPYAGTDVHVDAPVPETPCGFSVLQVMRSTRDSFVPDRVGPNPRDRSQVVL